MVDLEPHVENFLEHIRIEKNYSEQTKETYRIALNLFIQSLKGTYLQVTEKKCIFHFIGYLKDRGNSDITIAQRLIVLKVFFSYLVKKHIFKKRQLPAIEKYKTTKKIISIPTDEEVNLFIDSIEAQYRAAKQIVDTTADPTARLKAKYYSLFRDLTFFTLVAATGLRLSEALHIKVQDMNWSNCTIKILGKGAKERLIFFGIDKLTMLFTEFFRIREQLRIDGPYLFVSYQYKKVLTPRYIQKVMKRFLDNTSSSEYSPHSLRHYYATRSIEKGANIKAIAVLLGHADPSTTLKMYFHISIKYLKEVFETMNPFSTVTLPVAEMINKRYEMLLTL